MSVYRHLWALALVCTLATRLTAQTARVATTTTAITQTQSIQTGYVIVTPTDGLQGGLVVSANLLLTVGSQMPQGVFTASPLVNAAALPVIDNEAMLQNTGLAIVNPNTQAVDIRLVLRQAGAGDVPLSRNFTLGAGQQSAQFVNQLFANPPVAQGLPAVLTIVASLPVGVAGFNFEGTNFGAVPVVDLARILTPSNLALLNADIANGAANADTTGTTNGVNGVASTATASSTGVDSFPTVANGVGGNGALLLPQFAINGGWNTTIVIVNPAAIQRTFRVDFFDFTGAPMTIQFQDGSAASLTNITLPAFATAKITPVNVVVISSSTGNVTDTNPTNGLNGTPGTPGIGTGAINTTTSTTGVNGPGGVL